MRFNYSIQKDFRIKHDFSNSVAELKERVIITKD